MMRDYGARLFGCCLLPTCVNVAAVRKSILARQCCPLCSVCSIEDGLCVMLCDGGVHQVEMR